MKRRNYLAGIFHSLIITSFLLGFSACGYKADPFYSEQKASEDKDVVFIEKEEKQAQ